MNTSTGMDFTMAPASSGVVRRASVRRTSSRGRGKALSSKQKNEVKRLISIRSELKYFPAVKNFVTIPIAGTAVLDGTPFDVPQGVTDTSRVGDSLNWCGTTEFNIEFRSQVTADTYNHVRFVYFQWHGLTTAAPLPAVANIFLTGPTGVVGDVWASVNHDQRDNYTIFYDKVFTVYGSPAAGTVGTNSAMTTGPMHIRVPLTRARKHVQFVAGGGQGGTGRMFMYLVSDAAGTAGHLEPKVYMASRIFFRDS